MRFNKVTCTRGLRIGSILDAILHIRHGTVKFLHQKVGRVQEGIGQIARLQTRLQGGLFQLGRVGQDGRVFLSRGHSLRTRQGGHVHNEVDIFHVLCGVRNSISQHQPSLGVAIVDFHRFARVQGENIIVPKGLRSNGIFRHTQETGEFVRIAAANGCGKASQHSRGTAHVHLHSTHAHFGFERQTTRVVDNGLADEAGLFGCRTSTIIILWRVLENHQPRRARGRLANAVNTTIPFGVQVRTDNFRVLHRAAELLTKFLTFGRVPIRGQFGRGHVDPTLRQLDRSGGGRGGGLNFGRRRLQFSLAVPKGNGNAG
mmetsp:Transcript_13307/g.36718  ORF Transcript_13307/g.36718 Transcript_13307/m.36718 type:complete len:315 (+) Transcript_13307:398-1342(+)